MSLESGFDAMPKGYGRCPRALLRDPSISRGAKLLYTLLEDYATPQSPVPFPSKQTLAEYLGVTTRTVHNDIMELANAGWLEKIERPGTSNRYILNIVTSETDCQGGGNLVHAPWNSSSHEAKPPSAEPQNDSLVDDSVADGMKGHPGVKAAARKWTRSATITLGQAIELNEYLNDRIAEWNGGARPKLTKTSLIDMRKLCDHGGEGLEPMAQTPERVRKAIDEVFDLLDKPRGPSGFCWAKVIQSPGNLREHWGSVRKDADIAIAQRQAPDGTSDRFNRLGRNLDASFAAAGHDTPNTLDLLGLNGNQPSAPAGPAIDRGQVVDVEVVDEKTLDSADSHRLSLVSMENTTA